MNPAIVILSVLLFTSAIMCATLLLAWLHFGRERHVLTWTLSYGISTFQWIVNAAGLLTASQALLALAGFTIAVSSGLVAIGARQRARLPIPWGGFTAVTLVVGALVTLAFSSYGNTAMRAGIASTYAGLMMAIAAAAIWPQGRRFTAPELAFFAMLALFSIFQISLGIVGWTIFGGNAEAGLTLYRAIMAIGLPPIYIATGLAAVLLIAGDLAGQLRSLVSQDQLTGVLNRRGIEEAAIRAIADARRHKRPLAIVICDIDNFKHLNDSYGHIAGDRVLRTFAQALMSVVRRGDIVGRLGGDEFCILLVNSRAHAAADVMERVRSGMPALWVAPIPSDGTTASFGVADLKDDDHHLDHLIARADKALYDSKAKGRDRITLAMED